MANDVIERPRLLRWSRGNSEELSYAERTTHSPYRLIRYAHQRRYDLVSDACLASTPEVIVDYGAGNGQMLLTLLADARCGPSTRTIAYEPWWAGELSAALEVHEHPELARRVEVADAEDQVPEGGCDVVACCGVLEHIPLRARFAFYEFAARALRPGGRIVIDVPVELGPAVLAKTFGRRVLKGYDKEYSLRQLLATAAGMTVFDPKRYDPRAPEDFFVSHKGFDHRLLMREMAGWGFKVERAVGSPVTWLPPTLVNQEAIFVATL
jgi:SAM-dependent methyltransferase